MSELRVAVRPPEFLPRLSYLALVDAVDTFILADTFAYSRQSHQNRTPIRTPDGRMWLTVSLEQGSRGKPICDVRISGTEFDPGRLWRAIRYNYEATPYFVYYAEGVRELLYEAPATLGALTVRSTTFMTDALRIETTILVASERACGESDFPALVGEAGGRYVSAEETAAHDARHVAVRDICRFESIPYPQAFEGFEADLASLDLLMNWGPGSLALLRDGVRLIEADKGLVKPDAQDAVG